MTPFDSATFNRLAKRIGDRRAEKVDGLCAGGAQDYADYRNRVGYIKAIDDMFSDMSEIESELRQGK